MINYMITSICNIMTRKHNFINKYGGIFLALLLIPPMIVIFLIAFYEWLISLPVVLTYLIPATMVGLVYATIKYPEAVCKKIENYYNLLVELLVELFILVKPLLILLVILVGIFAVIIIVFIIGSLMSSIYISPTNLLLFFILLAILSVAHHHG